VPEAVVGPKRRSRRTEREQPSMATHFLQADLNEAGRRRTLRVRLNLALTRTPDDKLGPYEIVAPVGKGGMGARHTPPRA
jgi:hypothetical protein